MIDINDRKYKKIVKHVLKNKTFNRLYDIEHHGISRYEHLIRISYYSYKIAKRLNFDYKSVAIGGLLHDFYLDGNERSKKRKFLDTFTHPKKALDTSINNFNLNQIEKNIIVSHMFPIYLSIPKYRESILVNLVDKIIGFHELVNEYRHKFKYQFNYLYVLFWIIMFNK